jgi:hypothetical protein
VQEEKTMQEKLDALESFQPEAPEKTPEKTPEKAPKNL